MLFQYFVSYKGGIYCIEIVNNICSLSLNTLSDFYSIDLTFSSFSLTRINLMIVLAREKCILIYRIFLA